MQERIGRATNIVVGDLQLFIGKAKELTGPVAIFRNNGPDGSLSRKPGFEMSVRLEDLGMVEELARLARIQNNMPDYLEIIAKESEVSEFSGRVAEVWKVIESDPVLLDTVIHIANYDTSDPQLELIELNGRAVLRLAHELCVLDVAEDDAITPTPGSENDFIVSGNPAMYKFSPGLGGKILDRVRQMKSVPNPLCDDVGGDE